MVANAFEQSGHSFASTRLYDTASGAPITISFAIPVLGGVIDALTAGGIRESLANLIAAGFSVNAPEAFEGDRTDIAAVIRGQKPADGSKPAVDKIWMYAPWGDNDKGPQMTTYLDESSQIAEFEAASGLKVSEMPIVRGKTGPTRESGDFERNKREVKFSVLRAKEDAPGTITGYRWVLKGYVGSPAPQPTPPSAPTTPVLVPKADAAPKVPAASQITLPIGNGSDSAASTNGGWISPATWVKTRAEWDAYLASALTRFHMDSDAVDNAHRRLSLCDKVGIGDWHKQRGWAIAALVAAFCKYDSDAINVYTAGLPAKDSVANLDLDRMARLLVQACPADNETDDDPFAKEFGADKNTDTSIAAELKEGA